MSKGRFLSILLVLVILACGTLAYGYQAERTPEYALQEIMTGVVKRDQPRVEKYVDMDPAQRRRIFTEYALPRNIARMQRDLARYGIKFDNWFLESSLHKSGAVRQEIGRASCRERV